MNKADRIEAGKLRSKIDDLKASFETHDIYSKIKDAVESTVEDINDLEGSLDDLKSAEEEKLDNMADGLKESDTGQAIEAAITALENAKDQLSEACDALNELTEKLQEASEALESASDTLSEVTEG